MRLLEHPDFEQAIIRAAEHFRSRGLREAIIEVKSHLPHPFYWAPFVLMGKS